MRRTVTGVLLAFLLALGACGQNKRQDLAECRMEALKVYPNWKSDNLAGAVDMGDFTFLCMKKKGYADSLTCPSNPGNGWISETDEQCYRKTWPWE
jgi:hypothetical protein